MWFDTAKAPKANIFQLAPLEKAQAARTWTSNRADPLKFEHLARENKEVTTLYNIAVAVGSTLSLKEITQTLYKESSRLLNTANFAIALYDTVTDTLNFTLVFLQGRSVKPFAMTLADSQGLMVQVLANQTPLLVRDLAETGQVDEIGQLRPDKAVRSWLGAPIFNPVLANEGVQGVIVTWSYKPNAFDDHELWLLSAIGIQAAIAVRNARLFESSQRRALELAVINDMAQTLASTLQLDEVLQRMMEQVEGLLNVEAGSLLLTDPVAGDLVFQIALGDKAEEIKPFRLARGQGRAGQVALTGKPLLLTGVAPDTRNALVVPLLLHGQVIGVLEALNKKESNFTWHDVELLNAILSYAAIAIENARLHESILAERDRVLEAEEQARRELAHGLHDGPTQVVSAVMMRLDFCKLILQRDPNPTRLFDELTATQELAKQAVHEIRTLLFELRPLALETQGLVAALEIFLERRQMDVEQTTELILKVETYQPNGEISKQDNKVEAAIFAIVQETVNNAIKHARAGQIIVELQETPAALITIISDNGDGFEVDQVMNNYEQRGSLGMINIRERATLIGSELILESAPGQGTRISLHIPKALEERQKKRGTTGPLTLPPSMSPE